MLQINTNTNKELVTEFSVGNTTIITTLSAVEVEDGSIPMMGCEVALYIDGERKQEVKGYIMPFRGYCFSVQASSGRDSSQIYTTGAIAPETFAEFVSHDTYGDVFIVPQIVECVAALGGKLPMRRIRGVSMDLLQNFKAQCINWVMNKSGKEMSDDQRRFVADHTVHPNKKKDIKDYTPEQLMEAVLRGEVTLKFN